MYRAIILLHSVSTVCTEQLFSCSLCKWIIYRGILLQFVTVRYIEGYYCIAVNISAFNVRAHYCPAVCVSAVFTGALLYCSVSVLYLEGH